MNNITASTLIKNQITHSIFKREALDDSSSTFYIEERLKNDKIKEPLQKYKSQIIPLENELFKCLNLIPGEDIISEDMPLIGDDHNNYYLHLFRTAKPDPNKENFFFIHGFLSSGLHFLCLIPYLIKRYNIFIPDTIGMGLSARPQKKFYTAVDCENYFINIYHLTIKNIIFKGRFNIKQEYYLCGHSLGGFFASRYMLKYPQGIKKVLLLSPAGITDYRIPGTTMNRDIGCGLYCASIFCTTLVWPCNVRVQNLYRCCCFHNLIKKNYQNYSFNIDQEEIKKNPDGSDFKVDEEKIGIILGKLAILSLEYPNDLYDCAFKLFGIPPPAAYLPIEKILMEYNKIETIIVFGEKDWMDKKGAYRLCRFNPNLYKVYTVRNAGHSFAMENPKELCYIIGQHFEE
jgi:pimeloyl-ACP methyl ester carboxylesterase